MTRIVGALVGVVLAVLTVMAMPGSAFACEGVRGEKVTPASDRLEGKVAALLTAEVAGPSSDATSLGVTLLVRSDGRLVTVIVLEGAQIVTADGTTIVAEEIPPAASVLLTGRWAGDDTFEATRIELR